MALVKLVFKCEHTTNKEEKTAYVQIVTMEDPFPFKYFPNFGLHSSKICVYFNPSFKLNREFANITPIFFCSKCKESCA